MTIDLEKARASLGLSAELKRTGLLNPFTARALLSAFHSENAPEELNNIAQVIEFGKLFKSPFDIPDASVAGPIVLGASENKKQLIGMYPDECHCLIAGQTGSGKSTLLKIIFSQAISLGMKVWLFVRAKEMRRLLEIDKDILVVNFNDAESIKINPLNPCGMNENSYSNIFADIFIQSQTLYDGSKNYLIESLNKLYEKI